MPKKKKNLTFYVNINSKKKYLQFSNLLIKQLLLSMLI